jgi:hypothetical protein
MPYRAELAPGIGATINSWGLPDFVFVEVHLRLRESLPEGAPCNLLRVAAPFDGLVYFFEMVDPENRFVTHAFAFHVVFLADEETIRVVSASYLRQSTV